MKTEVAEEKMKQKRMRKAPYRKWSDWEQQQLANFLRENRPIEKPTAQVYYRRFLAGIGSKLEWTLVRCKVKNLRQNFLKAKSWLNGSGSRQDGETKKDVLARMCPLYDELEEIFGNMVSTKASVLDTEDSSTLDCPGAAILSTPSFNVAEISTEEESSALPETSLTSKAVRKGIFSPPQLADMLGAHSSWVDVKQKNIKLDLAIREKELLIKEKEYELQAQIFKLNKEKYKAELQNKEAEVKSQERIKIMEIQMRERIALKELEMKERIEMAKLKIKK